MLLALLACLQTGCTRSESGGSGEPSSSAAAEKDSGRAQRASVRDSAGARATDRPCRATSSDEAGDLELARCLAAHDDAPSLAPGIARAGVVLYVDRSRSMRGFLDPRWPMRQPTDFRAVLDRLIVSLRPVEGFSYGAALKPITPSVTVLSSTAFYSDGDTRLEDAVGQIALDTTHERSHIILGDARRGSPATALAQFERLRSLADRWTSQGGTFMVAASSAPFAPVAGDPSGCLANEAQAATAEPRRCPLYLFAFVPRADAYGIASALAPVFDHLFAWPAMQVPSSGLAIQSISASGTSTTGASALPPTVERRWTSSPISGAPVVRTRGAAASNRATLLRVHLADTSGGPWRGILAAVRGDSIGLLIQSRAFRGGAWRDWEVISGPATVTAVDSMSLVLRVLTRGATATKTMYRVDLLPSGHPRWVREYDAEDAGDMVRTFALSRLFSVFAEQRLRLSDRTASLGHFFIVAN